MGRLQNGPREGRPRPRIAAESEVARPHDPIAPRRWVAVRLSLGGFGLPKDAERERGGKGERSQALRHVGTPLESGRFLKDISSAARPYSDSAREARPQGDPPAA